MSLQGDLKTLELADLLQGLEQHARNGTLTLEREGRPVHLYFKDGRLALLATEGRSGLMELLVACGQVTEDELAEARKRRKRSKKSVGQMLIAMELVDEATLGEIAKARLTDEACERISGAADTFKFTEGAIPRGVFDPEERRLGLALPSGALLLEAARRNDHWEMIRTRVPSDSAHYIASKAPKTPLGEVGETLEASLFAALDGSCCVGEVMQTFPHLRFEAYRVLADWVADGHVRMAAPNDLVRIATELAPQDPGRARTVLERGLELSSRHTGLLREHARLAEAAGDKDRAAESVKLLAHHALEAGDRSLAREELTRAKLLDPTDASVWERSLALALEDQRFTEARADGFELAALYRKPGLHRKALTVFESLVACEPHRFDLVREVAASHADCGELSAAIVTLERFGKAHMSAEEYTLARAAYEEILVHDPGHDASRKTIEGIDEGSYERQRATRRRHFRMAAMALAGFVVTFVLWREGTARVAYSNTMAEVSESRLIEGRHYAEARRLFEAVAADHPYTTTSAYDVPERIAVLHSKERAAGD